MQFRNGATGGGEKDERKGILPYTLLSVLWIIYHLSLLYCGFKRESDAIKATFHEYKDKYQRDRRREIATIYSGSASVGWAEDGHVLMMNSGGLSWWKDLQISSLSSPNEKFPKDGSCVISLELSCDNLSGLNLYFASLV